MTLVAVAAAGALGAVARFALERSMTARYGHGFPWGTLAVNVTGSFALGLVVGAGMHHGLGAVPRAVLGTGFLGGYTTFSTFTVETVRLWEDFTHVRAAAYALASIAAGTTAAALGLALT